MSTRSDGTPTVAAPDLTALGKRLELLRIERGISKQLLARLAGTSRQQLWRVATGKSELTTSLRLRLADALEVDAAALTATGGSLSAALATSAQAPVPPSVAPATLQEYVSSSAALERTLATLPEGESGWRLKRLFLNCLEEVAADAGLRLPPDYFALRARITNREQAPDRP